MWIFDKWQPSVSLYLVLNLFRFWGREKAVIFTHVHGLEWEMCWTRIPVWAVFTNRETQTFHITIDQNLQCPMGDINMLQRMNNNKNQNLRYSYIKWETDVLLENWKFFFNVIQISGSLDKIVFLVSRLLHVCYVSKKMFSRVHRCPKIQPLSQKRLFF